LDELRKYFKTNVYFGIFLICLAFVGPGSAFAQNKKEKQNKNNEEKRIEITSDRMRSENDGAKIIFSGNVVGTWDDLVIKSKVLEIYNRPKKSGKNKKDGPGGNKKLDEVVAIGNVVITRGNKKAIGDRAIYFEKLQKIILTGTPKATAWEEDNVIEGREMIFYLEKDRFVVNERVHVTIFPDNENESEKDKSSKSNKSSNRQLSKK
jgi:lipopolysaccharide export system protein LptA